METNVINMILAFTDLMVLLHHHLLLTPLVKALSTPISTHQNDFISWQSTELLSGHTELTCKCHKAYVGRLWIQTARV